jgi:energy-coupling factor transport system ATP-binding protein
MKNKFSGYFMKAVEIEDLSVAYFGRHELALRNVSLSIEEGEFILLTGKTGSGKSTLLNAINGVIPHIISVEMEGSVHVFGQSTRETPLHKLSTMVGTVYQTPENQIFSLIVEDDVAFGLENMAVPRDEMVKRVEDSLRLVNLWSNRSHPTFLLSGGQKQRLAFANALALRPKLLVLDEPTSQLDSVGTEEVFGLIRSLNKDHRLTVIMSEHKLERAINMVDRIVVMDNGSIIMDDEPHKVLKAGIAKYGLEEPQVTLLHKSIQGNSEFMPITVDEFIEVDGQAVKQLDIHDIMHSSGGEPRIIVEDLFFRYEKNSDWVLNGINLMVKSGEFVSVIGPNGSGKSTLMNLISGIYRPQRGKILVAGVDVSRAPRNRLASLVGYVFQDPDYMLFNSTVENEIRFTMNTVGIKDESVFNDVVSMFKLNGLLKESPHRLSVGQRRLVSLAAVLVARPLVLMLDEPTRGLDYDTGETMMSYVKELQSKLGLTVFMVTHNMKQVGEYSDKVIVMNGGRIVMADSAENVFTEAINHKEWAVSPPQVFMVSKLLGLKPFASLRAVMGDAK